MIIDRLSVFVKWKFWKQLKKDGLQKEAAKKMKNRKNNWIKIVIQLLSFILIPELFVTGFTAIGDIFFPDLCWKYFLGECQVFGVCTNRDSARKCTGGEIFCGFFCSFGAVQDFLWFAARKLGKRQLEAEQKPEIYKKADRVLKLAKYGVLVYFVIFIWSGVLTWEKARSVGNIWPVYCAWTLAGSEAFVLGGDFTLGDFGRISVGKEILCRYFCPMGRYALISRGAFLKIKPGRECSACSLCTAEMRGIDFTKKEQVTGGECIEPVHWLVRNAHFGIKYGMVIGLLTCVMIGASGSLRRSY